MKKLAILLFIFCLLVITGCSAKEEKAVKGKKGSSVAPKEVKIGYQVIPNAELLTKEQGLVEKEFPETTVKWLPFDSGRDVNTAMASGTIDLGLVGSVPLATGIANKLPYQVYYIHDVIGDAESLVVRKDTKAQEVKDLEGKKIAVPFGSTAHFSLLMALDQAGVDSKKVSILDMQPQDILAAWLRKDIDGAFVWNPTLGKILESDGTVITSAKQLAEKGIVTSDVGVIQNSFAKKHPEFVKDYVKILDTAVKQYRDNPEKAAASLAPVLSLTEEQTKQQMEGLIWVDYSEQKDSKYLGTNSKTGQFANVLESTGGFLKDQGIINTSPDLSSYQSAIYHLK